MADVKRCAKAIAVIMKLESNGVVLDDSEKNAIAKAFGVRGRYKGYLKQNKPNGNKEPMVSAAWCAMQPNPFKISIGAVWFMEEKRKAFYDKLARTKEGKPINYPANFDLDMEHLQALNVW